MSDAYKSQKKTSRQVDWKSITRTCLGIRLSRLYGRSNLQFTGLRYVGYII